MVPSPLHRGGARHTPAGSEVYAGTKGATYSPLGTNSLPSTNRRAFSDPFPGGVVFLRSLVVGGVTKQIYQRQRRRAPRLPYRPGWWRGWGGVMFKGSHLSYSGGWGGEKVA